MLAQYEFRITSAKGKVSSVLCTAQSVEEALRAVRGEYASEFGVHPVSTGKFAPHYFLCEIDATQ